MRLTELLLLPSRTVIVSLMKIYKRLFVFGTERLYKQQTIISQKLCATFHFHTANKVIGKSQVTAVSVLVYQLMVFSIQSPETNTNVLIFMLGACARVSCANVKHTVENYYQPTRS